LNGYDKDQRRQPYTNNKLFSPTVIWGILTWLLLQTVGGTTYIVRMEGDVGRNAVAVQHVKELQRQENDHTKEALEEQKGALKDLDRKLDQIEQLLRENLKE